jgi:hypothetical protein
MTRIALLGALLAWTAAAQPPVIRVIRTDGGQSYPGNRTGVNMVGLSPLAGRPEAWLVELYDSFGSLEDQDKVLNPPMPAVIPSWKPFVGMLRPGLSYRAQEASQSLPKMRYVDVATYQIQSSAFGDFEKYLKSRRAAMSSVNLDRPNMVYQIVAGEPLGTFVVLTPLPSLRVFDDAKPATPVYAEGAQAAEKNAAAATDFVAEHTWFRIDPRISAVSDDFASQDMDFWRAGR